MKVAGDTRSAWARLALLFLVAMAAMVPAHAADSRAAQERRQRLHAFLQRETSDDGYLGAVMLVARNGKVIDRGEFGHPDLARRKPMRRDAIFRVYSMTKPIASVALLMLLEEGKVTLDDPVSRFLPEFAALQRFSGGASERPQLAPVARPLTVRNLLTHTSGFASDAGLHPQAA